MPPSWPATPTSATTTSDSERSDVRVFFDYTLNGLSTGMIYAAVALSLVLIWRSTRILNFASGSMAMFTTYLALSLVDRQVGYWLAVAFALVSGFVLGAVVERTVVRAVESKPPINAVIVTLGLFILLEAVAGMIWGSKTRSFPAYFSGKGYTVGNGQVAFGPFDTYVVVSVGLVMLSLLLLFRFTSVGLKMRAAAFEPMVARLQGVRVSRLLTLGWALSAAAGSLAAILVAPNELLLAGPSYMEDVLVFGFAAAVLGGLDSPIGALIGGLVIGLGRKYVSGYIGTDYEVVSALVILIIVLMFRPEGLFSRVAPRRV
jgi:branched-chain amino acid transport system permease protein